MLRASRLLAAAAAFDHACHVLGLTDALVHVHLKLRHGAAHYLHHLWREMLRQQLVGAPQDEVVH
eukprot:830889-Rhodomonas_salina.1